MLIVILIYKIQVMFFNPWTVELFLRLSLTMKSSYIVVASRCYFILHCGVSSWDILSSFIYCSCLKVLAIINFSLFIFLHFQCILPDLNTKLIRFTLKSLDLKLPLRFFQYNVIEIYLDNSPYYQPMGNMLIADVTADIQVP